MDNTVFVTESVLWRINDEFEIVTVGASHLIFRDESTKFVIELFFPVTNRLFVMKLLSFYD